MLGSNDNGTTWEHIDTHIVPDDSTEYDFTYSTTQKYKSIKFIIGRMMDLGDVVAYIAIIGRIKIYGDIYG